MTDLFLYGAAALTGIWCLVHLFAGGAEVAGPLRRTRDLTAAARDAAWLCWHFVSITLALMAGLFALGAAVSPHYAVAGLLLAGGFAAVSIVLVPVIGQSYRALPQGWLFVPVAVLAVAGLAL